MGNLYAKEKQFRSIIEKLIISSDKIDSVDRLYEEIFGSTNAEEVQLLAEKIAVFFQDAETLYGHSLLKFNNDTFIYQVLRVKSSIKKITLPYGFMVSLSYHT